MGATNRRRINYHYLSRLRERLEALGHDIDEIPVYVVEQTWDRIRTFLEEELLLKHYCVRCKLPIHENDVSLLYQNMCTDHAALFSDSWLSRRNQKRRRLYEARVAEMLDKDGTYEPLYPLVPPETTKIFERRRKTMDISPAAPNPAPNVDVSKSDDPTQDQDTDQDADQDATVNKILDLLRKQI